MSKRFVVLLDSETEAQSKSFEGFGIAKGLFYWHWLQNSWLIVDPKGVLAAPELRDEVRKSYPQVHSLVIEIKGDDFWAGYGPQTDQKNMFAWLRSYWKGQKKE